MTHVNLEDQPTAVKDFFLKLPNGPDGSVVAMNGKPVAWVIPPSPGLNGGPDNLPWTAERNRRRFELIERKYKSGITPLEEAELADLQAAMHRFVDAVAPLPIEEARKLHQELMEKAIRSGKGT